MTRTVSRHRTQISTPLSVLVQPPVRCFIGWTLEVFTVHERKFLFPFDSILRTKRGPRKTTFPTITLLTIPDLPQIPDLSSFKVTIILFTSWWLLLNHLFYVCVILCHCFMFGLRRFTRVILMWLISSTCTWLWSYQRSPSHLIKFGYSKGLTYSPVIYQ